MIIRSRKEFELIDTTYKANKQLLRKFSIIVNTSLSYSLQLRLHLKVPFFVVLEVNIILKQSLYFKILNRVLVPQAKSELDKFKMEAAREVGVNLSEGYNGDLTSRQNGSVRGQMVKHMVESYEKGLSK